VRRSLTALFVCALAFGQLPAPEQAAIDRISPDSLRTNLQYLASDALEGRGTPSRGLDLAADYIAKQFQDAGLSPAAGDSYFQAATFDRAAVNLEGFQLLLRANGKEVRVSRDEVRVRSLVELDLAGAPVIELPENGAIPPIEGKIVVGDERRYGTEIYLAELQSRKPALVLLIGKTRQTPQRTAPPRPATFLEEAAGNHAPVIRIRRSEAAALLLGGGGMTVSLHLARPVLQEAVLRNVAGVVRGSDDGLRNQYVLVTAHYDHLGKTPGGIFHGANDNGSGTVSVIEIARALAALNPHPKRSIVFMTFFGEEEGLLGSYYYAEHPLVPLRDTVVDINLEQMGRTDEKSGKRIRSFTITGPSYSSLPEIISGAAKAEDIGIWKLKDADGYFDRSDNYAFAVHGVVAHTIAVAAEFSDYHALGDTWEKIDYANMAKVDRGVAAGIVAVADDPDPPKWSNAKGAAIYRDAGR
jgi:Peptidase family M28